LGSFDEGVLGCFLGWFLKMIFENETLFQFRNKLVFGAGKY
jgi:hypothetical protein